MNAKPILERDYALARIARALGCAGYPIEECDAIMAWVQGEKAVFGRATCHACDGEGDAQPEHASDVVSEYEMQHGMLEETRMLVQGICLACRGKGWVV